MIITCKNLDLYVTILNTNNLHTHGFKYSYLILIICKHLYGFKSSYQIVMSRGAPWVEVTITRNGHNKPSSNCGRSC